MSRVATPIQNGERMLYTNGTGSTVAVGAVIDLGGMVAIAATDIPDGDTGALISEGVWELPAINTAAFTQGEAIYWDGTAGKLTNVDTNTPAGYIWEGKAEAGTTALVKIG